MFHGPPGMFTPNIILICSAVFAQRNQNEPHDRQTDRQTAQISVTTVCISCTRWSFFARTSANAETHYGYSAII